MDVYQWLQGTMPSLDRSLPGQANVDSCTSQNVPTRIPKAKGIHRKSKTDSSLLEVAPEYRTKGPSNAKSQFAQDGRSNNVRNDPLDCELSTDLFVRRCRRKTHADKYDPLCKTVKESKKHVHHSRKDGSRRTKRMCTRQQDSKPGGVKLPNFKAKNMARDRLTLKPREPGIFNKGKTSVAFRGRGCRHPEAMFRSPESNVDFYAVPDLVFSEMKFLQNPIDREEYVQVPDLSDMKNKKNNVSEKENEVSSYFARICPITEEEKRDISAENNFKAPQNASTNIRQKCDVSSATEDTASSPEMLHDTEYVGLERRNPLSGSSSYVTWSKTNRDDLTESIRGVAKPKAPNIQTSKATPRENEPKDNTMGKLTGTHAPHSLQGDGNIDTGDKANIPSTGASHVRMYRSNSNPLQISSLGREDLFDRASKMDDHLNNTPAQNFMAPAIPGHAGQKTRAAQSYESSLMIPLKAVSQPEPAKVSSWNQPLRQADIERSHQFLRSSSFDEVLQRCNDTCRRKERVDFSLRGGVTQLNSKHDTGANRCETRLIKTLNTHQIPTVRFLESDNSTRFKSCLVHNLYARQEWNKKQLDQRSPNDDIGQDQCYGDEQHLMQEHSSLYKSLAWNCGLGGESEQDLYDQAYGRDCDLLQWQLMQENNTAAARFWRPNRLY